MESADIGFIGGVLGTAFGIIGALFGAYVSTKKIIKNILERPDIAISDKLNRVNEYVKTLFSSFIVMIIFLVSLGFLLKYVNVDNNKSLYVGLLLTLIFSFQIVYFYIWRKYIKRL